jgi:ketosteroid isomerase-like protein
MSSPPSTQDQVLQASLSGDVTSIVSLFAEDAVVMPPNDTSVYGRDEIRSWWEEYFTLFRVTSSVETECDVSMNGDQAFVRTSFSVTIVPKQQGPRILDDIRSLTVWKQDVDGEWKITHWIWNSTKPVGSGTNRYMTRMLQKKGARSS